MGGRGVFPLLCAMPFLLATLRARAHCYATTDADSVCRASGGAPDAATVVQNLLNSLRGAPGLGATQQQQQPEGKLYPLLSDLLDAPTTTKMVDAASESSIDKLLDLLPTSVILLSQQVADEADDDGKEPSPDAAAAVRATMSLGEKRSVLKTVLRSPQFHQSLTSLTLALRDGGLPSVSEALGVKVENGGRLKGSAVPLGGGEAVEAFVEGVKRSVQEKQG
jgi:26S proteasome regulatory subunit N13